jgi:hypothetical protein
MRARLRAWWRRTRESLLNPFPEQRERLMEPDEKPVSLTGELHKHRTLSRRGG